MLFLLPSCRDRARTVDATPNDDSVVTSGQETSTGTNPEATPPAAGDSLFLSLQRTACFGTCPSYKVEVYESGYATYEGRAHVERIGSYTTHVDRQIMETLANEAERHGFFTLNEVYDSPVTDLPSTILIIQRNGDTKKVTGRVGQPQAFKDLAGRVEEILLPLDWKPVPDR
jgi:hypothetical protein